MAGLAYQVVAAFCETAVVLAVDVVEIGELFYDTSEPGGKGRSWTRVVSPVYILKGDSVVFLTISSDRATWPTGKPVWSGGVAEARRRFYESQKFTFDTVGDTVVSVECGNTMSATVKVAELVVRFDSGEERPGIGAARKATVKAKAMRTAAGADITINLASDNVRATVSPASFVLPAADTEKEIDVTITGVTLSGANRDTNLTAKSAGTEIGTIPITVVKPTKYTIRNSATSGAWRIKDKTTTIIIWNTRIFIWVEDQFGQQLLDAFEGAHIQEKVKNPGAAAYGNLVGLDTDLTTPWSPLNATGVVSDMVRGKINFRDNMIAQGIQRGTRLYPKDFGLASPEVNGPFLLKFFIDGVELQGVTRRMRSMQDNKETVTNTIE